MSHHVQHAGHMVHTYRSAAYSICHNNDALIIKLRILLCLINYCAFVFDR